MTRPWVENVKVWGNGTRRGALVLTGNVTGPEEKGHSEGIMKCQEHWGASVDTTLQHWDIHNLRRPEIQQDGEVRGWG